MNPNARLANLSFTTKIVLLVGLMGFIAIAITGYAITNMRAINAQYRALIAHEARGALYIADAERHLGNASRLAYTVLTEQEETRMHSALAELAALNVQYNRQLERIGTVLPGKTRELEDIGQRSSQVFNLASAIINAAARWRGDQALQIIHAQFEPTLAELRHHMDMLRDGSVADFEVSSIQLNQETTRTIAITAAAVLIGLAVVMSLSIYVAVTQMSRPIAQLTHTMRRLTDRHYGDAIVLTGRRDEIGTMAIALQVFKDSMQRADRLAVEVKASAEARRLSEQLVDLVDAIPGAVFQMHVRPDGWRTVQFLSDKAAEFHDRPLADLLALEGPVGHGFARASAEQKQLAQRAFTHSVSTLEPLDFDMLTEHRDGPRWLKTLATARRALDGGAVFNGVWLDVTEQKLQAEALALAKDVAEQAAAEKASFLATMSHEIRTPLNAILGLTQLALKDDLTSAQRDRVEKSLRASKHLLGIVNDVLDFSKIEAGQMVLEATDFSLTELVSDVQDLYTDRAKAKHLQTAVHLEPGLPVWLRGDPHRIAQILINYLNNAFKFTAAGGVSVGIGVAQEDEHGLLLHITVRDTGMGISEEEQQVIFTPFQQANASITRRFGGTGLGLSISRRLAALMGGHVGVHSSPGAGSEFWFTARVQRARPRGLAPSAAAPAPVAAGPAPHPGLRGKRILLVDDNELNRTVACGLMEWGGVLVDTASDGLQALALLEAAADDHYAAVLMDVQMPVLDGIAATRRLRRQARFAELPIVAMTAHASVDDIARTRAAGMSDHLSKPVLEEALWRCLQRHLVPAATPSQPDEPRDVDPHPLRELHTALGRERFGRLVADFLSDSHRRLDRIHAAANGVEIDWETVLTQTHAFGGTAGSFGLNRLGALAQELKTAADARDEGAVRSLAAQLRRCSEQDRALLAAQSSALDTAAADMAADAGAGIPAETPSA